MKKKLFRQIRNEWQANLWLTLELMIVSVVMWYCADLLYSTASMRLMPSGFDRTGCYQVELRQIHPDSPNRIEYSDDPQDPNSFVSDLGRILDILRAIPMVEAVAIGDNAVPYQYNYYGSFLWGTMDGDTLSVNVNRRQMSPDFCRVLGIRGINGETPEELAEILRRGDLIVSENAFHSIADRKNRISDYVGMKIILDGDTSHIRRVGAIMPAMKRTDYEVPWAGTILLGVDEKSSNAEYMGNMALRVKPGQEKEFEEYFRETALRSLHSGNLYVTDVEPFDDLKRVAERFDWIETRNTICCMAFLLLCVFLGLLGTFWFRTQQRVSEISIRKVNGATNWNVFRRLTGEGLGLLCIATVPAVAIDLLLAYFEFNSYYKGFLNTERMVACTGGVFLLMAVMIIAGIWFPARKAMKVDPAVTLRSE